MNSSRKHVGRFVLLALPLVVIILVTGAWRPPSPASPPAVPPPHAIFFVDDSAASGGDGSSWGTAFRRIEDALLLVVPGDQVWVAEGVYIPLSISTGFQIPAGVSVYGAFKATEASVDTRLGSASSTILEGQTLSGPWVAHVVTMTTVGPATGQPGVILDAFQIQHGRSLGSGLGANGAGIWCRGTDLDVVGCILVDNRAQDGGGLYFEEGPGGTATTFNILHIKNSEFKNNFADTFGGGVYGKDFSGFVMSTKFRSNEALAGGGGVYLKSMGGTSSDALNLTNCEFWGNWVENQGPPGSNTDVGGAILVDSGGNGVVVNCSFSDNFMREPSDGQAVHIRPTGLGKIYNSVFGYNIVSGGVNLPINLIFGSAAITVEYCDTWISTLAGGSPYPTGLGNIGVDPKFRNHALDLLTLVVKPLNVPGSSPCLESANYALLAPPIGRDVLDLDHDGDTIEAIPIDLLTSTRLVDRWEANHGVPAGSDFLDMGAYEMPQ